MASYDVIYIPAEGSGSHEINCTRISCTPDGMELVTPFGVQRMELQNIKTIVIHPHKAVRHSGPDGNICKRCRSTNTGVSDIRWTGDGQERVRKRRCKDCGAVWSTVEVYYWDSPRRSEHEQRK